MNETETKTNFFDTVIENVVSWTLTTLAFLLPLFFLPTTANFYEPNKFLLVILATAIVTVAWSVQTIINKNARFTSTQFTLPLTLIGLVYLASSLISQSNRIEALMGKGLLIPLLAILFVGSTSVLSSRKVVTRILYASIASATILGFISIFQSLGGSVSNLLNSILGTTIPSTLAFSPAGSPLALLTYIVPVFIIALLTAFTKNEGPEKIALFLLSAVMLGGIVINGIYVAPGTENTPVILPFSTGYSIAIETLKQPLKTALLGYGPENFANAYTSIRPASSNQGDLWNVRFSTSSNELFTIITSIGALGLLAWVFLVRRLLSSFSETSATTELKIVKLTTMVLFVMQLLVPTNIVLLVTTYLLLTVWAIELKARSSRSVKDVSIGLMEVSALRPGETHELQGEKLNQSRFISLVITVPLLIGIVALSYFTQRAYAGEMLFRKSLVAASKNDGTNTYEYQRQAIEKNPFVGGYHRTYAITNLQLASTIAAKADLSDQDRSTVAQLIQQAIREGKAAVSLDPTKTPNWEALAQVYRNLINVAEGSQQWTIASYVQAISTDPASPRLRLELGGIYFQLKQYDQAIRLFQQATELKPNWANAYYNLSAAYKEKGELQNAYVAMKSAASLVDPNSVDAGNAQKELADLEDKLKIKDADAQKLVEPKGDLSQPEPLPSPLDQPINLPENAGPDTTENIPSPTIEPAPEN